ncbi:MAG: hypothetical protein ACTHOM_03065 [Allomuricauda sp.]
MDLAFAELEYTEQRVNPTCSTKIVKAPHKRGAFFVEVVVFGGNQRIERSEGFPIGFLKSREFGLR